MVVQRCGSGCAGLQHSTSGPNRALELHQLASASSSPCRNPSSKHKGAPSMTGWLRKIVYTVSPVKQGMKSVAVSALFRSACDQGAADRQ